MTKIDYNEMTLEELKILQSKVCKEIVEVVTLKVIEEAKGKLFYLQTVLKSVEETIKDKETVKKETVNDSKQQSETLTDKIVELLNKELGIPVTADITMRLREGCPSSIEVVYHLHVDYYAEETEGQFKLINRINF